MDGKDNLWSGLSSDEFCRRIRGQFSRCGGGEVGEPGADHAPERVREFFAAFLRKVRGCWDPQTVQFERDRAKGNEVDGLTREDIEASVDEVAKVAADVAWELRGSADDLAYFLKGFLQGVEFLSAEDRRK